MESLRSKIPFTFPLPYSKILNVSPVIEKIINETAGYKINPLDNMGRGKPQAMNVKISCLLEMGLTFSSLSLFLSLFLSLLYALLSPSAFSHSSPSSTHFHSYQSHIRMNRNHVYTNTHTPSYIHTLHVHCTHAHTHLFPCFPRPLGSAFPHSQCHHIQHLHSVAVPHTTANTSLLACL